MARKKETSETQTKKNINIKKLKLLVTIVNRSKSTYYEDLLEQFEVNMQMVIYGKGTANSEMLSLLGIGESDKSIIFSFIKEDLEKEILDTLDDKFKKIKNGKGIAYTIPMQSIIGASIYQFLSNNKMKKEEKVIE